MVRDLTALKEHCPSKYMLRNPTQQALLLTLDLLRQPNTFFTAVWPAENSPNLHLLRGRYVGHFLVLEVPGCPWQHLAANIQSKAHWNQDALAQFPKWTWTISASKISSWVGSCKSSNVTAALLIRITMSLQGIKMSPLFPSNTIPHFPYFRQHPWSALKRTALAVKSSQVKMTC